MPVTRRKATTEKRIDESRCVDRNTDDPAGAFNAFENDPAEMGEGEGKEVQRARELVDESDKKFIRRSVGAALPHRVANREKERRTINGEEEVKNKVAIHCKESANKRTEQTEES